MSCKPFLVALVGAVLGGSVLQAGPPPAFSFDGQFSGDDSIEYFAIDILSPDSSIFVQTYGFGGGTNGNSQLIAAGGFGSDVFVFDPSGNVVTPGNNDACPPAGTVGGNCFDSSLSLSGLGAGTYILALTVDPNAPLGTTPGEGFAHNPGSGNFTCDAGIGPQGGAFCDAAFEQRNGNWALDVSGSGIASVVDLSAATPEPGTFVLLLAGTGALVFGRRYRAPFSLGSARNIPTERSL